MQIIAKNVLKKYGRKIAVDIESLEIKKGEITGLVGNNGAGKTTLFRLILDLAKSDKGEIRIGKYANNETDDWKLNTASFLDNHFLIDFLTPEEYFYFVGKLYGHQPNDIDNLLKDYADFMNGEILNQKKYIREFSAGNKQKVGIISALLTDPKLLILDEPFNYLDPRSQNLMKQMLENLLQKRNTSIFVSSHSLNHIGDISNRILLMEKSKIIKDCQNTDINRREIEQYFSVLS